MGDKRFCFTFKLGFLQLTCEASLIVKSNLQLALSIISSQRELYESKHVTVGCRCFKKWHPLILFDIFNNPSFKMTLSVGDRARTTAITSKLIY